VQSINSDHPFWGCPNLTQIDVDAANRVYSSHDGVLCKGDTLIAWPSGKSGERLPDGIKNIGHSAFRECYASLGENILSGVTNVERFAFYRCNGLNRILIPGSMTNIADYVFTGCGMLESVEIPSSVKSIALETFGDCANLKSINVADDNTKYSSLGGVLYDKGRGTLLACPAGVEEVAFASGVTRIAERAFWGCHMIKEMTIPTGITHIDVCAFLGCDRMESVTLPATLRSIGNSVFAGCSNLRSVTILGALDDYTSRPYSTTTSISLTTYVTSVWTGPTDTWCNRSVSMLAN